MKTIIAAFAAVVVAVILTHRFMTIKPHPTKIYKSNQFIYDKVEQVMSNVQIGFADDKNSDPAKKRPITFHFGSMKTNDEHENPLARAFFGLLDGLELSEDNSSAHGRKITTDQAQCDDFLGEAGHPEQGYIFCLFGFSGMTGEVEPPARFQSMKEYELRAVAKAKVFYEKTLFRSEEFFIPIRIDMEFMGPDLEKVFAGFEKWGREHSPLLCKLSNDSCYLRLNEKGLLVKLD